MENLVKHQKVSEIFENDLLRNFFSFFVFSNSYIWYRHSYLGWNLLHLSGKGPKPNLEFF